MSVFEKFKAAKIKSDNATAQFPDGYTGDVVIDSMIHKLEGFYGPRFIVNMVSVDGKQEGYMSLPAEGKWVETHIGRLKSCFCAALGFDPYVSAEVEKSGVNGEEAEDIAKAALNEGLFSGHVVRIKVSYKRNDKDESNPFKNFKFFPVLENGEPKVVKA